MIVSRKDKHAEARRCIRAARRCDNRADAMKYLAIARQWLRLVALARTIEGMRK